jgi:hypothetical protein
MCRRARDLPLFLLDDGRKTIKCKQRTTKMQQPQPGSENYHKKEQLGGIKGRQGLAEAID